MPSGKATRLLALLALLGLVAGCAKQTHTVRTTTTTHPVLGSLTNPEPPGRNSVSAGHYVVSVEIGDDALEVSPPPKDSDPAVGEQYATSLFEADTGLHGTYDFEVLGLGSATIAQPGSALPGTNTTTTLPPGGSSPTSTSSTSAPSSSTSTSSSTTTSSTTTSSTLARTTTTTTLPLVPLYEHRLAWVGFAVGAKPSCPGGSAAVVAVLVDAETGRDVVSVSAGGCGTSAAEVSRPQELESVPWTIVGSASTAIAATIPACGRYVGWTELATAPKSPVEVEAAVPYDPQCATTSTTTKVIDLVIPLGSTNSTVAHAATGRIDNLDVLP